MTELVCPACKNGDNLWVIDSLRDNTLALMCGNCDWEGTTDDLVFKGLGNLLDMKLNWHPKRAACGKELTDLYQVSRSV